MPGRVLYLIRKSSPDSLLENLPADQETSAVLLQDAVSLDELGIQDVYVLDEDARARNVASRFPSISYKDMVRMMFEAEKVVAL